MSGKNVAFAAGTGMLVFVDLIAHMILKRVAEKGGPDLLAETQPSLPDDFKLELYTSFYNEDEAVGLELIKALENLYQDYVQESLVSSGIGTPDRVAEADTCPFVHVGRLNSIPKQKAVRWDQDYFRNKFDGFERSGVAKVYICAPPIVQEFFDRAAYNRVESKTQFHAL